LKFILPKKKQGLFLQLIFYYTQKKLKKEIKFQKKHPHVIYEYSDRSPQGCGVPGGSANGNPFETHQQRNTQVSLNFSSCNKLNFCEIEMYKSVKF